jgi:hypothetical protein
MNRVCCSDVVDSVQLVRGVRLRGGLVKMGKAYIVAAPSLISVSRHN